MNIIINNKSEKKDHCVEDIYLGEEYVEELYERLEPYIYDRNINGIEKYMKLGRYFKNYFCEINQHIINKSAKYILFICLNNDYFGGEMEFYKTLWGKIKDTIKLGKGTAIIYKANEVYSINPILLGKMYWMQFELF